MILQAFGLTKYYLHRSFLAVEKVTVVNKLDLAVAKGEIFGFLGPNGAGKTTTLNMVVGLIRPSGGRLEIFGEKVRPGAIDFLQRIGYVPETTSLPGYYSVFGLLDFYAQFFHIPAKATKERIGRLLEAVGLSKEKDSLLKNLSMGQRRLVDIAQALINEPDLILLDEPTVYLDPLIMERLRNLLLGLKAEGKTIVMASHMLSEIEKLSDRVAIIDAGNLLKTGSKEEFMRDGGMEEEFLRLIRHDEALGQRS